jgi:NADH:ubiquinone oxidoreductase subunit
MTGSGRVLDFLKQFFTWWNGQTLGLRWFTARKGERVGEDEFGNVYYRAPSRVPESIPEHRWVIYNGYAEASAIPPGWHGWMHHTVDTPPSETEYKARDWQKPHHENRTGTPAAYRPKGSIAAPHLAEPKPDYQPWQPQ